jgi:tetratricopeptide (TPR) repeat protein
MTGDHVVLLHQDQGRCGVFGVGTIVAAPVPDPEASYDSARARHPTSLRLTKLVDPNTRFLLALKEIETVLPRRIIGAAANGYPLTPAMAAALASRLGMDPPDLHEPAPPEVVAFHTELSIGLAGSGRLDEAVQEAQAAADLAPMNPGTHAHLGNLLAQVDRLDEAEAEHRTAIKITPDNGHLHGHLSHLLAQVGRLDEAIAAARRAVELVPEYAPTVAHLGKLLARAGELEPAAATLRQAVALEPECTEWQDILTTIEARQSEVKAAETPSETPAAESPEPPAARDEAPVPVPAQQYQPAVKPKPAAPPGGSVFRRLFGGGAKV